MELWSESVGCGQGEAAPAFGRVSIVHARPRLRLSTNPLALSRLAWDSRPLRELDSKKPMNVAECVVICEKPSQARNIREAVGGRYGQVIAAQGHLLRLAEPDEVKAEWKAWTTEVLLPPGGLYGRVPDTSNPGKQRALSAILAALKTARRCMIATDCDREGQAIGDELLAFAGFRGEVLRAMFTAEDPESLQEAFASARPNADYRKLFEAAEARAQSDAVFNLTLTRGATVTLRPPGAKGVIGIGRVKTATMAIVAARELDIRAFVVSDYFELSGAVVTPAGRVTVRFKPGEADRISNSAEAEALRRTVAGTAGPVSVKTDQRSLRPPLPMTLPLLQRRAAAWGWDAAHTAKIAQSLYETHKITTYPRAESRYLPEAMIPAAGGMLASLRRLPPFTGYGLAAPVIRTGKAAVFSDAGLAGASHHGIVPNPRTVGSYAATYAALANDERKLFDVIAAGFLAAIGQDYVFDETVIAMPTPATWSGKPVVFSTRGRAIVSMGWRSVLTDEGEGQKKTGADDDSVELPPLVDGQPGTLNAVAVDTRTTKASRRYTEGSLVLAMENPGEFVVDSDQRERLKMCKGIGRPSTRDGIIESLKEQGFFLVLKGKQLGASDLALSLYELLREVAPDLVDPGATARMEIVLDAVLSGHAGVVPVVEAFGRRAGQYVAAMEAKGLTLTMKRRPSEGMLEAAKRELRKRNLVRLPKGLADDADALSAWLGPRAAAPADGGPTPAQRDYAVKLAAELNRDLPEATLADGKALRAWLDEVSAARGPRLVSDKQRAVIAKAIAEGSKAPKGWPDQLEATTASAFLDALFKKGRKGRNEPCP